MIRHLKKQKVKIFKTERNLKVFLSFLLLSTFFWLLIKLSKEYISDANFKVVYKNVPTTKVLQNKQIKEVRAIVKTHGFNLLSYHILNHNLTFDLKSTKRRRKGIYYYLPNYHLVDLQSQLSSETEILRIFPDTILLKYGNNKTKKLYIKPNVKVDFAKGFNLVNKLKIEPKYVHVIGPEVLLKKLDTINTVLFKKHNISSDINDSIALKLPLDKKLHFSVVKVKLIGKVVRYTENTLNVPFEVVHISKDKIINVFPKTVKITYKVSLSNFNLVKPGNFRVICDFNKAANAGLRYLTPVLIKQPKFVSDVRISPEQIEYLVKK